MSLTLLSLIQRAARRMPLTTVPTTVVGSSSPLALQFLEIAQEVGDELVAGHEWNRLITAWEFNIDAADPHLEPFPLDTGFDRLQDKALLWRSDQTYSPLAGPLSPAQWQLEVNQGTNTPGFWRRYGTGVQILGVEEGVTITTSYINRNWIITSSLNEVPEFQADDDTCIFPDRLMVLGIRWRWKQSKGLEYGQDYEDFQMMHLQVVSQDTSRETIHSSPPEAYPGKPAWPGTITPVS